MFFKPILANILCQVKYTQFNKSGINTYKHMLYRFQINSLSKSYFNHMISTLNLLISLNEVHLNYQSNMLIELDQSIEPIDSEDEGSSENRSV